MVNLPSKRAFSISIIFKNDPRSTCVFSYMFLLVFRIYASFMPNIFFNSSVTFMILSR